MRCPWTRSSIYQPAHRFWTFQSIETAIFVALAMVLLFIAARWLEHRMA